MDLWVTLLDLLHRHHGRKFETTLEQQYPTGENMTSGHSPPFEDVWNDHWDDAPLDCAYKENNKSARITHTVKRWCG